MLGHNKLGIGAYISPPAIVQQARNCQWYVDQLEQLAEDYEDRSTLLIKEFKESGVWREKYLTWDEACSCGLGVSRRWANRLIAESNVSSAISGNSSPTSDDTRQANSQENTPQKEQLDIATTKFDNAETEPEVEQPPRDVSGCIVPQKLLPLWQRKKEVTEPEHWASRLGGFFEWLQSENDPLFLALKHSGNIQTFAAAAKSMRHLIAECLPEVVCPICQGVGQAKHQVNGQSVHWCFCCFGSGMISELRWNRDWVKSHDAQKLAEVKRREKAKE